MARSGAFQFEYLTSLGFAALVIFAGRAIVRRSRMLRKFAIPVPVVSGLLLSIVIAVFKGTGVLAISFDTKVVQDLCQNLFFLCVGFGFSLKLLKHAGGKLCALKEGALLTGYFPSTRYAAPLERCGKSNRANVLCRICFFLNYSS